MSKKKSETDASKPRDPEASPISGVAPPKHTRYGQPGAPKPGMPKGCKQPTKLFKNAVLRYLNAHPELVSEIAKARVDEARFASSQENPKGLAAFQVLHDMLDGPIVKEVKTTGEATTTVEVVRRDPKAKEAGEDG